MPGSTPELALKTAVDADDNADYLTLSLADSLRTVDALFSNTSGHTHSGVHQGGPIGTGSIPDGSITSAKIADGTITSVDLAGGAATNLVGTYAAVASFSTTSTGAWQNTPVTVSGTTTGAVVSTRAMITLNHNGPAGSFARIAIARDGAPIIGGHGLLQNAVAGSTGKTICMEVFENAPAGAHTWTIQVYNGSAGTLQVDGATLATLYVQEFKR